MKLYHKDVLGNRDCVSTVNIDKNDQEDNVKRGKSKGDMLPKNSSTSAFTIRPSGPVALMLDKGT